jgi:hypothetical protein
MLPHELYGKFSSKADFIKYFRDNLQLYLPPDYMMSVLVNPDKFCLQEQGLPQGGADRGEGPDGPRQGEQDQHAALR